MHTQTRTAGTLPHGHHVAVERTVWSEDNVGRWSLRIDGHYSGPVSGEETDEELLEAAATVVAERREYAQLVAELEPLSAYLPRGQEPDLPKAGVHDVTVGDVAWIYSRGNVRRGKVEKVGRSKIHVVYVSSTGTISRKSDTHVYLERRVDLGEA